LLFIIIQSTSSTRDRKRRKYLSTVYGFRIWPNNWWEYIFEWAVPGDVHSRILYGKRYTALCWRKTVVQRVIFCLLHFSDSLPFYCLFFRWVWVFSVAVYSSGAVYTRGANQNDVEEWQSTCGQLDNLRLLVVHTLPIWYLRFVYYWLFTRCSFIKLKVLFIYFYRLKTWKLLLIVI